jgi:flagellar basal-body rod modification protein FlgD
MPNINGITSQIENDTNKINFTSGQKRLGKSSLDKDAFLQLLISQLKNQDPLNPQDTKDFIQQQAALTQVEKLDQLVQSIQGSSLISQGGVLVGKQVELTENNQQQTKVRGKVSSVSFSNGEGAVTVNNNIYTFKQINKILDTP